MEKDKIGFRHKLFAEFHRNYPELHFSEQRVADQYRVILRNKLVPDERLNTIKNEVQLRLQNRNLTNNEVTIEENYDCAENQHNINAQINTEEQNSGDLELVRDEQWRNIQTATMENREESRRDLSEQLSVTMNRYFIEFEGTDPLNRPILPRLKSSKKLSHILHLMNKEIIPPFFSNDQNLESLHLITYCAASTISAVLGVKPKPRSEQPAQKKQHNKPHWQNRLEAKVHSLRQDIGRLTQFEKGSPSRKLQKIVDAIMDRHRRHANYDANNESAQETLDTLKQKLSVYSERLRRYNESYKRKHENMIFENSEKNFYRMLNEQTSTKLVSPPSAEDMESFWTDQLSTPTPFNSKARWIRREEKSCETIESMPHSVITSEELQEILKNTHNWKSPGPDGIHNFWLKKFWCLHGRLVEYINNIIHNPTEMPTFLTTGITYLIPKDFQNTMDPSKYRPITCLPTIYKIITSCLASRIYKHCEKNKIITTQQKGCSKNAQGSKEQLVIDSIICNQAFKKHRNLFMTYFDYKKAFDSLPHGWLKKILEIYKIDPIITNFLKLAMDNWKTNIELSTANIKTKLIPIKRGIFQGDSMSPLWFCLALNPLSKQLNATEKGFNIKGNNNTTTLNHLLYMDDLKLITGNKNHLEIMVKLVEHFSKDVGMEFGLDKCRTLSVVRGRIQDEPITLANGQQIEAMKLDDLYKYLGMKQNRRINHQRMKQDLTTEFIRRTKKILKTNLNSRNMTRAINTYACSILTYSFGIVPWSKTDIENLQRKMRTLMTKANKHHPKSSIERTTLPRNKGGRGLTDIMELASGQIESLREYFRDQASTSEFYKILCEADESTPLQLHKEQFSYNHQTNQEKLDRWREKPLHGRHFNEVNQDHVDIEASNYWLTSGAMYPETEGFLLAIQDQVISTRNYCRHIIKDRTITDDRCRYGCPTNETIQHITGGCQMFAGNEYKERHDAVGKILHQEMATKLTLIQSEKVPYYKYRPETILENERYKLYWDRTVLTDKTVPHNRPDILLVDKQQKAAILIDVAIPNNNNMRQKEVEKISKYRDLEFQIKRQWGMISTRTIPIIISTTGIVPKNLKRNIKQLGLSEYICNVMQKAVLLGTARTVRKFLGSEGQVQGSRVRGPEVRREPGGPQGPDTTELYPSDILNIWD